MQDGVKHISINKIITPNNISAYAAIYFGIIIRKAHKEFLIEIKFIPIPYFIHFWRIYIVFNDSKTT